MITLASLKEKSDQDLYVLGHWSCIMSWWYPLETVTYEAVLIP